MAQERTIACKYYDHEGCCTKGRAGTFWHQCQTCNKYDPLKMGSPARLNNKKEKLEKARVKDAYT